MCYLLKDKDFKYKYGIMDENIIFYFLCIGGKMLIIWINGDVIFSWRGIEKYDVIINGVICY